jgi:hypothetical protein
VTLVGDQISAADNNPPTLVQIEPALGCTEVFLFSAATRNKSIGRAILQFAFQRILRMSDSHDDSQ